MIHLGYEERDYELNKIASWGELVHNLPDDSPYAYLKTPRRPGDDLIDWLMNRLPPRE